jgi:phospholipid/cholesterol/gamma-HCH transport system substrate-binding protein
MTKTFPTAFAERNKIAIALIGMTVMALLCLLTFNAASLPIIGGGKVYSAQFSEAGGLKEGNEVRVAGVKVGKVTDISLDGAVVTVKFRAKVDELGDQSTASVKVKTMLGQKFLAVDPLGSKQLDGPIPLARTTTPYDVNEAFSDLSDSIETIDTDQLEASFTALSDAFRNTPDSVRTMVTGLTDLSRTISSRDDELTQLFAATNKVSGTLKDRNAEFAKIITDGSSLLEELEQRRDTVSKMLDGTARLGVQLQGLVKDNEKALKPALAKLDDVSRILQDNQDNLDAALKRLGPYYRVLSSAMGNGSWVDSYVCGLFGDDKRPLLENDVVRNCAPAKGGGR